MKSTNELDYLEEEILQTRTELMIKGFELDYAKQKNSIDVESTTSEIVELKDRLSRLLLLSRANKKEYYVIYETKYYNPFSDKLESETVNDCLLIDYDVNVDLPDNGDWKIYDSKINSLLCMIMNRLNKVHNEVLLKRVITIKN